MRRSAHGAPVLLLAVLALLTPLAAAVHSGRAGAQSVMPRGRIAFVRSGEVWVWNGGSAAKLFGDGTATEPRWSPDGRQILYVRTGDTYSDLVLRYLGADPAQQHDIALTHNRPAAAPGSKEYADNSAWVRDPSWSPSGMIAFASDHSTAGGRMALFLLPDLKLDPVPAPDAGAEGDLEAVSLSTAGDVAGYTVRTQNGGGEAHTYVALRDLADGSDYTLIDDPNGTYDPSIGPDDEHVAVTIRSASGGSDLWLVRRSDRGKVQLTNGANAFAPTWSPDGRWLAYLHASDNGFEIWAMPFANYQPGAPVRLAAYADLDATGGLSWTLAPQAP